MGDIWAMGAKPQAALATVILPRMSSTLQERWLEEIMAGADAAFGQAGATIAGGHTSLGSELTIGFTVTGLLDAPPLTRGGARAGDALILTRPIGTGVILAGDMALKAPGDHVAAMLREMSRNQGAAAETLSGAHAMTDVTGFGLAGHLLGICRDSRLGAEISLDGVPLYDGALSLSRRGIRSTLTPENEAAAAPSMALPDDPRVALLFDPQTAGGFLAALPEAAADNTLERLRQDGVPAARIGRMVSGPPRIAVLP